MEAIYLLFIFMLAVFLGLELIVKVPSTLHDPPATASPACLTTGRASPVTADSSTPPIPASTVPSVGKKSPGFTRTTSPGASTAAAIGATAIHNDLREADGWTVD